MSRPLNPPFTNVVAVIIGVILYCSIVLLSNRVDKTQLTLFDEENFPNSFIGERAKNNLEQLTNIGPKVVGSYENEVLTVNFLKKQIKYIIKQANENQDIILDHQIVSGSFYYNYENLQNIVVRLSSKNNSNSSLLINCHFDSVPRSPGGSDDGINCVNMLEVLRIFSKQPTRPVNNLIFLFNGGEEIGLEASHGFITKHKWAKEVRAFINLEGAGAGGREILFQAGPGNDFLLDEYSKSVPHPFGQSLGEEIFQNDLIPSDTDFRIFRDYGNIPGMDFAFIKNGYVYHTKYDNMDMIKSGVYQSSGENLLALVKSLANSDKLKNATLENTDKAVYFDFLGFFFIKYNLTIAITTNFLVLILSCVVALKSFSDFKTDSILQFISIISTHGIAIIVGGILSFLFSLLTATILDELRLTMSWYTNQPMIFGLYFCPTIIFCSGSFMLVNYCHGKNGNIDVTISSQIQAHVVRLITGLFLLTTCFIAQRASYLFLMPVLFNSLTFVVIILFKLTRKKMVWVSIYLIGMLIPTIFWMYIASLLFGMFIPITGRIGSAMNPEISIGLLSTLFCFFIIQFFVPLITLLRKPIILIIVLALIYIITFGCVAFTSYGFPYSDNPHSPTPQRYEICHVLREFYDENGNLIKNDAGYAFLYVDRNFPNSIKNYVNETNSMISIYDNCGEGIFCELPYGILNDEKNWIPASPPNISERIELQLLSKTQVDATYEYVFEITGPDRIYVIISPKPNMELADINSSSHYYEWNGRSVYSLKYNYGLKPNKKFKFSFITEIFSDYSSEYTVDIAVIGLFSHHEKSRTRDFVQFLNKFPRWAHIASSYAIYQSWIF